MDKHGAITENNDSGYPDELNALMAFYQRGLPQAVLVALSAAILGLQLSRQNYRASGKVTIQKPCGNRFFELSGQILNVVTLGLFMAARETDHAATNGLVMGYVCLLQLLRAIGPNIRRKTFRHHIDATIIGIFGLVLVMEGLPLAIIGLDHSVALPTARAVASLFLSGCVVVFAPHEQITFAEDSLGDFVTPTVEETCSWVDYLFTYSRAGSLIQAGQDQITMEKLDKLPKHYSPEVLRRKFSEIRKRKKTTTRALISLLWVQLLTCTTLGVLLAAAKLLGPMGLHHLLGYMQNPEDAVFQPWLWLAVIFAGRIAQTAFQQAYASRTRRLMAQVNGMMTAEVYHSTMASRELQANFLNDGDAESGETSQSTASGIIENLISSDIQSITQLQDVLVCVTAIPAAVAAVVGLYQLVGWPCIVGIVLALSGSPFENWVMSYIEHHEVKQRTAQDLRISLVSEYLRSIKILKYFGWEDSAVKNIGQARAKEQEHLVGIDIFSTGLALIAEFFPILSLVSIFGLHIGVRKIPLTASAAYTSVQLLEIVTDCLVFLALVRVEFFKAMVSLRRFDKFFKSLTPLDTYPDGAVEIRDATFQRAAGADFHLRDINIKFSQRGLNVVTGASGSGKSSLLLALLGETIKTSGSVIRQKDVAYAPQTPWLQSGTIQENIVFHNNLDEKRYRKVVKACCLDVDFAEMPHGDQTMIGEGDFALSGGQRARVALARTLFSDARLLLLDDIFSALDTKTTLELWNGVFCSDLLQDQTVILVTQHSWVAQEANITIVMDNGRVQSVTRREEHVPAAKPVQPNIKSEKVLKQQQNVVISEKSLAAPSFLDAESEKDTAVVAEQATSTATTVGPLSVFSFLMYFGGPLVAALTVSTCFFHTGASIYTNYWMSHWVEHSDDSGNSTLYYLGVYIGLSYLTEAIDAVRMASFSRGISVAAGTLHMDLVNSVMAAPLSWFTEQAISETLNRLSGDISTLDQSIYNTIVPVISNIITCMLAMATIASKLPVFTLPAVILMAIGYLVARMHERASHLLKSLVSSCKTPILSSFSEGLTGSMVIRATPSKPAIFHAKMNRLLNASSQAQLAQSNANQWLKFRMSILATSINVLAATLALSQKDKLSAGLAGFCLSQATQLSDKVLQLIFSFSSLSLDMQTFQRVREYTELSPEQDRASNSSEIIPTAWPKTGAVELRNVTVRYTPDGQDILKDVSLRIEPGERIAIVGRTGSGKSTLILSLLGFTDVESGQILYDGVDLASIPHKRLRKSIATIPQEAQLFQGTIASNLDPSGIIPEAELQNALNICQSILKPAAKTDKATTSSAESETNAAFTERLTLSTAVDSRGENFSHGQRQVLSLCRVLIRRSKLVLLDEATSSMDAETDAGVQEALRKELSRDDGENRALVTVAHRLQTIMDYDRVAVMGHGRILEVGSPKDLLAKKSAFYDMVMHSGEKQLISTLA